jgi:hypothetical protein
MKENSYQTQIIQRLREEFVGCVILKNDSSYIQGIPDIIILYEDRWAMLEVKKSQNASVRPNQTFYVNQLSQMSFAAFVYPENEDEVFYELQLTLFSRR